MGNLCCRKKKHLRRKIVLLLLGLDNAGKTVAVKHLAGENTETVIPTVGFSVVDLKYSKYDVSVYDLGGRPDFRDIWERYYVDAYGLIFVIDSSDYSRLNEAQEVLSTIVSHEKIKGKPVLLLANKQDNENALDEIDLIEKLELETLANENECPTLIQTCCASNGTKLDNGIKLGYNWLINCIINEYNKLKERVDTDVEHQEKIDDEERRDKLSRIKFLNEQEAKRNSEESDNKTVNGIIKDVFVVQNYKQQETQVSPVTEVESFSMTSSSSDCDSSPIIYYGNQGDVEDVTVEQSRPKSTTNLIRRQLQLDNLKRRSSLHFSSNKTTPVHLFGVKSPKVPKSATVRTSTSGNRPDRRNLRSAGDSVFIVSDVSYRVMPNNDGSGDLSVFGAAVRKDTTNTHHNNVIKDVLPPINDIHIHRFQNGNYF